MRHDPALDFGDASKRLVPARLEFAGDHAVGRIGGVILPEGAVGSLARRFEIAVKSLARLVPPLGPCSAGAIDAATAPVRRRRAALPRPRRRRAGHQMRCNAVRRYAHAF